MSLVRDTTSAITSSFVANRRYTMKDIGKLDQRITNLEYYTQLSLLEKKATDMSITDANGLDRFKNGIFVDPFSNKSLSDQSITSYSITIDETKGIGRPNNIREYIPIEYNSGSSSYIQKTGSILTLPYTEVTYKSQPYASEYRSSGLLAGSWNGSMSLYPSYDNHRDTSYANPNDLTVDASVTVKDSTVWGDWRTSVEITSNTVITDSGQVAAPVVIDSGGGDVGGGDYTPATSDAHYMVWDGGGDVAYVGGAGTWSEAIAAGHGGVIGDIGEGLTVMTPSDW